MHFIEFVCRHKKRHNSKIELPTVEASDPEDINCIYGGGGYVVGKLLPL